MVTKPWKSWTRANTAMSSMLTGHTILIGYGRVGSLVGQSLKEAGLPFLVVEDADKTLERLGRRRHRSRSGHGAGRTCSAPTGRREALILAIPNAFEAGQVVQRAKAVNQSSSSPRAPIPDAEGRPTARAPAPTTRRAEREIALAIVEEVKGTEPPQAPPAISPELPKAAPDAPSEPWQTNTTRLDETPPSEGRNGRRGSAPKTAACAPRLFGGFRHVERRSSSCTGVGLRNMSRTGQCSSTTASASANRPPKPNCRSSPRRRCPDSRVVRSYRHEQAAKVNRALPAGPEHAVHRNPERIGIEAVGDLQQEPSAARMYSTGFGAVSPRQRAIAVRRHDFEPSQRRREIASLPSPRRNGRKTSQRALPGSALQRGTAS